MVVDSCKVRRTTVMASPSEIKFRALMPLMGKQYFFPEPPIGGGKMSPVLCESDDEDDPEPDQFQTSKVDFKGSMISSPEDVVHYSDDNDTDMVVSGNNNNNNFDVVSFLSSNKRDFLDINDGRCYSRRRFDITRLRDKRWVMICCFFCPIYSMSPASIDLRAISNICSDLYDSLGESFAMVLVLKMRIDFEVDESCFTHMLSGFPSSCLVVPFWDSVSRDFICRSLGFTGSGRGMLLDGKRVVWCRELRRFKHNGVDSFPFTDSDLERTNSERITGQSSWNRVSLEEILHSSPSTVIGNVNKTATTSIEKLKEKSSSSLSSSLVGVYLCVDGNLIPNLFQIHESCRAMNREFEIVVVNLPFNICYSDGDLFQKLVHRALEKRRISSWWILPYKRWISLRIRRLCIASVMEDALIVFGKGFVEPHGAYVIQKLGMRAYPFSRELMFDKEVDRISNISLQSLLVYGERDYLIQNLSATGTVSGDDDKVPVASLVGKNILVIVDYGREGFEKIVQGNKDYYLEFEIVYVGSCAVMSPSCLTCPYDAHHMDLVSNLLFTEGVNHTMVVAFKKDGLIGSIQARKHLAAQSRQASYYPLDGTRLKQEVMHEFELRYRHLLLPS